MPVSTRCMRSSMAEEEVFWAGPVRRGSGGVPSNGIAKVVISAQRTKSIDGRLSITALYSSSSSGPKSVVLVWWLCNFVHRKKLCDCKIIVGAFSRRSDGVNINSEFLEANGLEIFSGK